MTHFCIRVEAHPGFPSIYYGLSFEDIPRASATARQIVFLARKIACLAEEALSYYRKEVLSITPMRQIESDETHNGEFLPGRQYEGVPYKTIDTGPPDWTETHRMMRAFWDLQLMIELKNAASRGDFGWPDELVQKLMVMDPEDFCRSPFSKVSEMVTAIHFLAERTGMKEAFYVLQQRNLQLPSLRAIGYSKDEKLWPNPEVMSIDKDKMPLKSIDVDSPGFIY
ncbi:hypothetical protein PT974_07538 [Cladobotryum mycophilum]|uniref:Uncharacterized protein n=1 Tax=Cladobotryum mycophilum TaxID=491253 RepID=A0ABR0SPS6_9HYPO